MQTILLPNQPIIQTARQAARQYVRTYFKDDYGNPFNMSDGQCDIFIKVFSQEHDRDLIMTYTQYGKSTIIAIAVIARSQDFKEDFTIVGGSADKAEIIMEKIIQHLFDHPKWWTNLIPDPGMSLERLKQTRSKENLVWVNGGSVRIRTGDSRNRQRVKEALTGFGSPKVICEEASLIPDDLMAMIMRMVGGHSNVGGEDKSYILKIGNAIYRNHFYRSVISDRYDKIIIPWQTGVEEGRISPDFIEEMRDQPFFGEMYECEFPPEDAITEGGYRKLITTQEILDHMSLPTTTHIIQEAQGRSRLGVDIGRGGNRTVFCLRYDNIAKILEKNRDKDLMANVAKIRQFMHEYNVSSSNVSVDDVGVGGGITDRLAELGIGVNAVKEGSKATESDKFKNKRAEMFWDAAEWIKRGGQLVHDDGFMQLSLINYKEDSDSRLKIEPKADLAKRGVESPDEADAFSLTFAGGAEFSADEGFAIL